MVKMGSSWVMLESNLGRMGNKMGTWGNTGEKMGNSPELLGCR